MKRTLLVLLSAAVWMGCPSKTDPKKDDPVKKDSLEKEIPKISESEEATSLEELVYDAEGASILKKESLAKSQAEHKARVELVGVLAREAVNMMQAFAVAHPTVIQTSDTAAFGIKVKAAMEKETTLKGSQIGEYDQRGDSTIASVEIALMSGYDVIEAALVQVGAKEKYIADAEGFRKAFREFFLSEKKKLVTRPS